MLHILPTQGSDKTGEPGAVATDVLWLDLLNPTSAEVKSVEEMIGATLPTLGALSEIESLYEHPVRCWASRGRPGDPSNRVRAVD
jgi:hypothetical protein